MGNIQQDVSDAVLNYHRVRQDTARQYLKDTLLPIMYRELSSSPPDAERTYWLMAQTPDTDFRSACEKRLPIALNQELDQRFASIQDARRGHQMVLRTLYYVMIQLYARTTNDETKKQCVQGLRKMLIWVYKHREDVDRHTIYEMAKKAKLHKHELNAGVTT